MKRILKYKDCLTTIGLILFIAFSKRLLDNEWAVYAGQTLIAMGLNLEFLNAKKRGRKDWYLQHHCRVSNHRHMVIFNLLHY